MVGSCAPHGKHDRILSSSVDMHARTPHAIRPPNTIPAPTPLAPSTPDTSHKIATREFPRRQGCQIGSFGQYDTCARPWLSEHPLHVAELTEQLDCVVVLIIACLSSCTWYGRICDHRRGRFLGTVARHRRTEAEMNPRTKTRRRSILCYSVHIHGVSSVLAVSNINKLLLHNWTLWMPS